MLRVVGLRWRLGDWEFYQERVRRARFDLDEAKVGSLILR